MTKGKLKCWNCKQETMLPAPELGDKWYRCSNCSATYFSGKMEIHNTGLYLERVDESSRNMKYKPRARRLPKKSTSTIGGK